jgi:hypothetical protein
MPLIRTRYGGDSTMDPTRRHRLENLLESYDHPDLWTDESLERMYARRLAHARRLQADGLDLPRWACAAVAVALRGFHPEVIA